MPPAKSSTPQNSAEHHRVALMKSRNSSSSGTPSRGENMSITNTSHASYQSQQSNWMSTRDGMPEQHVHSNVNYSLSTTTTGFDELTSGSTNMKRFKFKNSELGSFQQHQSEIKKPSPKHTTCQQHFVITSQKSLDMDDYSQDFVHHTPFQLLDCNENTLNSTTIIQINQNDLNRRLTSLKRGADSISKEEILRVLHLNQQQASSRLGCSVSTLKRKFYVLRGELGLSKWPNNYYDSCQKNEKLFKQIYPLSLNYILNSD